MAQPVEVAQDLPARSRGLLGRRPDQDMPEHLQVDLVEASSLDHELQLMHCSTSLDEVLHRDRHGLVAISLQRNPPEDPILASVERSGMARILCLARVVTRLLTTTHSRSSP